MKDLSYRLRSRTNSFDPGPTTLQFPAASIRELYGVRALDFQGEHECHWTPSHNVDYALRYGLAIANIGGIVLTDQDLFAALEQFEKDMKQANDVDPDRWAVRLHEVDLRVRANPILGDERVLLEIATTLYINSLHERGVIRHSLARYHTQIKDLFKHSPRPLIAMETLVEMLETLEDPSDVMDRSARMIELRQR